MLSQTFLHIDNLTTPQKPYFSESTAIHWEKISQADLEKIMELRLAAWSTAGILGPHLDTKPLWEIEDIDRTAYHFIIRIGHDIASAARLSVHESVHHVPDADEFLLVDPLLRLPSPICSLNRLVVDPKYWGLGLADKLLTPRLELAKELNCKSVVANAALNNPAKIKKTSLAEKYITMGFDKIGEIESTPGDRTALLVGDPSLILENIKQYM